MTSGRDPVRTMTRRLLPWLVLAAVAGRLLLDAASPLSNPDTFFHLRFGEEFWSGDWSLRHPGHLSTFESATWAPTQWLPEIAMALVDRATGLPGVAWLCGLLSLGLLATWYVVARRHTDPIVAALICAVAVIAAYPSISMRPQVLSFIALTVTTETWLCAVRSGRRPWWLIGLIWVWAMCHGMWPVGIAIGFVAVLGVAVTDGSRAGVRLLPVPVLQLVAAALTPVGPQLYAAVLRVSTHGSYFTEWGPPDFATWPGVGMLALLATAIALIARRRHTEPTLLFLVITALGAAVYSQRTLPLAAAILVPVVARLVLVVDRTPASVVERRSLVAACVLALGALAIAVPHSADEPGVAPAWVGAAVGNLPPGTALLDDSSVGGYLMWADPDLDLVEHGYGDVYTDAELRRITMMQEADPGWLQAVVQTGARYALQATASPLDSGLRLQGWRVAQTGGGWDLLVAPVGWPRSSAVALG